MHAIRFGFDSRVDFGLWRTATQSKTEYQNYRVSDVSYKWNTMPNERLFNAHTVVM